MRTKYGTEDFEEGIFKNMIKIMQEIDEHKHLHIISKDIQINYFLDMGCAPGGFSCFVLENSTNKNCRGIGITLPPADGGHEICKKMNSFKKRWTCNLVDVTTVEPTSQILEFDDGRHPFELIICDGHFLGVSEEYKILQKILLLSQLVIAFEHLVEGGNLVCKLSMKEEVFYSSVIFMFSKIFENVEVMKYKTCHRIRSSFYVLCFRKKNKQAQEFLPKLHHILKNLKDKGGDKTLGLFDKELLIMEYGTQLIEMYKPLWNFQYDALLYISGGPKQQNQARKKRF